MCKHKKTILLATLITSFLLACQVWAHNPGSDSARGVMAELAIVNGPDMNRAGYGWLNSSSEVGAETFFHDLCPQRGGGTFSAALCAQQQDLVASGLGNSLAWPAIESSFMLMTQAKIYEHAIMEAAAMGKPIPNVPSCLTGSTQATAMKAFVDANKDKDESDLVGEIQTLGTALKNKTSANPAADQEKMNQLIKMRSVKASFNTNRAAQALMLDKNLKTQMESRCAGATDEDKLACINIKGLRERIRTAFPIVFMGGTDADRMFGDNSILDVLNETPDSCGRHSRQRFETAIYEAMGALRSPTNISGLSTTCSAYTSTTLSTGSSATEQTAALNSTACKSSERPDQRRMICRGAGLANAGLTTQMGYKQLVNTDPQNVGLWNQTVNAMNFAVGGSGYGGAVPPTPALSTQQTNRVLSASGNLDYAMDGLKDKYKQDIDYRLTSMCDPTRGGSSLGRMMVADPTAVQQAVLDIPNPKAQQAVKLMMCQRPSTSQPYLERYQKFNQSFSCVGIGQNPDGSTSVKRKSWGWPLVGDVLYNVATEPNGTKVVNVPIDFVPGCDTYLTGLPQPTAGAAPRGLSAAAYAQLMKLSDRNKNGTIDPDEFDYFQLAHKTCDEQKAFAMAKATGSGSGWLDSSNSRWTSQGAGVKPPMTPGVRFNIQRCCASGCAMTCPAGTKRINISPCYNADTASSNCQNSNGNREAEQNYSFAQSSATTWHEMGHAMGLQDEYIDPNYPGHALGETGVNSSNGCGSTMGTQSNWAGGKCENLHRRHFLEILRPDKLNCAASGSGPADRVGI